MDVEPTASKGYATGMPGGSRASLSRSTLAAAFSTASEVDGPFSGAPCRLHGTGAGRSRAISRAGQDRFPHRRVNDDGFRDPGRLPSTSAPVKEPATHSPTLPSCDELPVRVHLDALSRFEARPSGRRGFSPVPLEGPRAARRLLQSKRFVSTTAELFEPCPPRVRSPSRGARTAGGAAFVFALPRS